MYVNTPMLRNFGFKNEIHWLTQRDRHLLKYSRSSANGFWLVYEDLFTMAAMLDLLLSRKISGGKQHKIERL